MRALALIAAAAFLGAIEGAAIARAADAHLFGTTVNVALLLGATAVLLTAGWAVLDAFCRARPGSRATRLAFVLGAGMMPAIAMVAAGPVWGLYAVLWPSLVLGPIVLIGAIARTAGRRS